MADFYERVGGLFLPAATPAQRRLRFAKWELMMLVNIRVCWFILPVTLLLGCIAPPGGFQKKDKQLTTAQCQNNPVSPRYQPRETDAAPRVPRAPFGEVKMPYADGTIFPSHVSRAEMDRTARSFYLQWKSRYLRQTCGEGRYQITTGHGQDNLTVSEAHGYGMIVFALMAGADPHAQKYFDGMFHFFVEHPSSVHRNLMAWSQNICCRDDRGVDSATDGDVDIAYALLLADRQWGSDGAINYREEALKVIRAIRAKDVEPQARFTYLGDWAGTGTPAFQDGTRSSDFILGHYRSFGHASGNKDWDRLVANLQRTMNAIQTKHSPLTGLLPDFIIKASSANPEPARAGFLEGPHDGHHYYNACRNPWRLGTDWLVSGDKNTRVILARMNRWIQKAADGKPSNILAGYTLQGKPLSGAGYETMAFIAPFAVSAMAHPDNQEWLDKLWTAVARKGPENYYADSIRLMVLITVSGNWWAPEKLPAELTPAPVAEDGAAEQENAPAQESDSETPAPNDAAIEAAAEATQPNGADASTQATSNTATDVMVSADED